MLKHRPRLKATQVLFRVRPLGHRQRCDLGGVGHFQIKLRVSYHNGLAGAKTTLLHQLVQHQGMGFGGTFIGGFGGVKTLPHAHFIQNMIQPLATFTRCDPTV